MKKISFLLLAPCLLSACAQLLSIGEKDYLHSKNGPSITIQPPLTDANVSHFYDLPAQTKPARVSIKPPTGDI